MGGTAIGQGRLLGRQPVSGLELDWNIGRKKPWRLIGLPKVEKATVWDLSVGGACVLAPPDDTLVPGYKLTIGINNMFGLVKVRWARPSNRDDRWAVGVEFVTLSDGLKRCLDAALDAALAGPSRRSVGHDWISREDGSRRW